VADKAKQVESLEQEVLSLKQEIASQKGLISSLEEKARYVPPAPLI
jgi:predicted RNase H-like nuclease (RuvC/YqgF family)